MVNDLMAEQYGLVTAEQIAERRITRRQIQGRISRGEWERVEHGVYRSTAAPLTWESRLLAACLTSGGVASHRCAAALWGIDGWWSPPVEITVPRGSAARRLPHRVHQSTQWDRIDKTTRRGIPCTGVERMLLDLSAKVSLRRTELAVESALRQNLTTWPALRACLMRHSRRGRDGCGRLRSFLELRYGDEALPLSEWSRLVANILVDAGLPAPHLEYRIEDESGQTITVFDLAWPRYRVALELDSMLWHLNSTAFERDKRKRNRARALGWTVHEATWSMTTDDVAQLVQLMWSALFGPSDAGRGRAG